MCVWSVITTEKWHGKPVDTTAKVGDVVSLGRPLGTTKEAGFGVSQGRPVSTTVEGRSIWCETCGYHSRLEGCLSGGGLC